MGNADGTGQHVPAPLSHARYATWSSDGSRIAWQNIAGTAGLVVSDPDGTNQVWIPNTGWSGGPTWYDSNTKLVFADYPSEDIARPTQLYVTSVLGTGSKAPLFATNTGCADTHPLARRNLIAFTRSCTSSPSQVWLYDKTAGTAHKVLDNASDADISPDGTKIVFSRPSTLGDDLFVSAIDGSGVTQLTTTGTTQYKRHAAPVWSPSGTRIAYYSNGGPSDQDTEIFDMATKTETVWLDWSWGAPSWQPINPSAPKPPTAPNDRGTYYPVSPYRVMDTRSGKGALKGVVGSGGVVSLQVTGVGSVPVDASTVVLNVTVTEPTGPGYVTVYPTGVARPTASSLNYVRGWTGANSVTVKVGAEGKVDLYNAGGPAHLIADVYGYYTQGHNCCSGYMGGQYHPLAQPVRLTDTRDWGVGRVPAGYYINSVASWDSSIDPHVRAFAVNVTATAPTGGGYLTAWNGDEGNLPNTSTLNYTANATVPNFAVVPATPCVDCGTATGLPSIGVYTSTNAHIIVDIVGFYDDGSLPNGLRFTPIVPTRIADTRSGQGWPSRLGPGTTASIKAPSSIANVDTWALATNVTAVQPTSATYLTVWPTGAGRPSTSNLNPTAGSVVPNAVQTMIGADDKFNVFNAGGYCDVVVDVVGTFYQYPPSVSAAMANSQSAPAPVTQPSMQFKRP
ncbi:DPP IV N-terminal domain-containing protein [Dactylosporangium sp. AC04546]|uniref:TolB family protein n=1 Tax=Dactylosporangium sp. AC04546 TaxID=2862460 RepID=UPI001EDFEB3C|nr:DPP IV N-terminal domain-containing protein [Dactylosporangium sp. AC04546]WVK83893.1 DPP IV N-terminal domain-containing protein [Dactylosporangium sp. AC04546]